MDEARRRRLVRAARCAAGVGGSAAMTDKTLPSDVNVEPTREVMRRIYMGFGGMSFRSSEAKLVERGHELVRQGWLVQDGGPYPSGGETWTRFKASDRLDVRALRDL